MRHPECPATIRRRTSPRMPRIPMRDRHREQPRAPNTISEFPKRRRSARTPVNRPGPGPMCCPGLAPARTSRHQSARALGPLPRPRETLIEPRFPCGVGCARLSMPIHQGKDGAPRGSGLTEAREGSHQYFPRTRQQGYFHVPAKASQNFRRRGALSSFGRA